MVRKIFFVLTKLISWRDLQTAKRKATEIDPEVNIIGLRNTSTLAYSFSSKSPIPDNVCPIRNGALISIIMPMNGAFISIIIPVSMKDNNLQVNTAHADMINANGMIMAKNKRDTDESMLSVVTPTLLNAWWANCVIIFGIVCSVCVAQDVVATAHVFVVPRVSSEFSSSIPMSLFWRSSAFRMSSFLTQLGKCPLGGSTHSHRQSGQAMYCMYLTLSVSYHNIPHNIFCTACIRTTDIESGSLHFVTVWVMQWLWSL